MGISGYAKKKNRCFSSTYRRYSTIVSALIFQIRKGQFDPDTCSNLTIMCNWLITNVLKIYLVISGICRILHINQKIKLCYLLFI
jgi:hypothetical protein